MVSMCIRFLLTVISSRTYQDVACLRLRQYMYAKPESSCAELANSLSILQSSTESTIVALSDRWLPTDIGMFRSRRLVA